jgi:hypothetical protein
MIGFEPGPGTSPSKGRMPNKPRLGLSGIRERLILLDADGGCSCVLEHVGERLLHDPIDRALDGWWQAGGIAVRSGATSTAPPSTSAQPPSTTSACGRRWRRCCANGVKLRR